jgi:hypothetical protein
MTNDEYSGRTSVVRRHDLVHSSFIIHHSSFIILPSPLDLAEFMALIPLSRGGDFVSQRDFMLPDGGL